MPRWVSDCTTAAGAGGRVSAGSGTRRRVREPGNFPCELPDSPDYSRVQPRFPAWERLGWKSRPIPRPAPAARHQKLAWPVAARLDRQIAFPDGRSLCSTLLQYTYQVDIRPAWRFTSCFKDCIEKS